MVIVVNFNWSINFNIAIFRFFPSDMATGFQSLNYELHFYVATFPATFPENEFRDSWKRGTRVSPPQLFTASTGG